MADGKYKPYSFYVPAQDAELMSFIASQSNMSLSMRLLMKAFIASNRHETDIDVSTMDLGDLIRSMRVDPALFDDVPRRTRPYRTISAIEAEDAAAAESAARERAAMMGQAPPRDIRSQAGFGQQSHARPAPPAQDAYPPDRIPDQQGQAQAAPPVQDPRQSAPAPDYGQERPVQEQAAVPAPAPVERQAAPARPAYTPPAGQAADDDLDPMAMMGEGF